MVTYTSHFAFSCILSYKSRISEREYLIIWDNCVTLYKIASHVQSLIYETIRIVVEAEHLLYLHIERSISGISRKRCRNRKHLPVFVPSAWEFFCSSTAFCPILFASILHLLTQFSHVCILHRVNPKEQTFAYHRSEQMTQKYLRKRDF